MFDGIKVSRRPIYDIGNNKINHYLVPTFFELDFKMSKEEIKDCIRELTNGKFPGKDGILNEMIKSCSHI